MREQVLAALVMGFITLTLGTAIVLRGPIGKAVAQWIASWGSPEHKAMEAKWAEVAAGRDPGEVSELRAEVEELQRQLGLVRFEMLHAELIANADPDLPLARIGGCSLLREALDPVVDLQSLGPVALPGVQIA